MCLGEGGIVRGTGSDGKGIYRGLAGILGRGVLLVEWGVTEREFTVDWGNFGLEGGWISKIMFAV